MAVSLGKGGNVSLSKSASTPLREITVGLGWDERVTDGAEFDLDAVAFVCNASGKVRNDSDFIFYNNLVGKNLNNQAFITHMGDNLTGGGDGDDEQLVINLPEVPEEVVKIMICVTIHEAAMRGQNFGMVGNAFVRVVDNNNGQEIARYDLSEDMSTETAMTFAEVYRNRGDWKFRAIGQGFGGGLAPLARSYDVSVHL